MENILEPRKNSSSGSILLLLMKETEAQESSVIYSRGHCWKEIMLKGQKVSLFFQESFLRTSHHTVGKQDALIKRAQVLAPVNIHPESLLLERFIPARSRVGCTPKPEAWRMRQIKPISTESIIYKILLPFPGKSSNWVRFPYKFSLSQYHSIQVTRIYWRLTFQALILTCIWSMSALGLIWRLWKFVPSNKSLFFKMW